MKCLVTGASGMLGVTLCPIFRNKGFSILASDINPVFKDIVVLDITDKEKVRKIIQDCKPDVIFHLAAETDVDRCQLDKKHAFEINAYGTKNIAEECKDNDIILVYISSGSVFNGKKLSGYSENDIPDPVNVYAKSKLEGEEIIKSKLAKYYIVRAGWMFGGYDLDKKFVRKIIDLLGSAKEIPVVIDKMGTLTFTVDLAVALAEIIKFDSFGIYHCVNEGICTRFDIAKYLAGLLGKTDVKLIPVKSDFFANLAPRGDSEALINARLNMEGKKLMRNWKEVLKEYVGNFKGNKLHD